MHSQDIAIVGFSFKLPQGIQDENSLWEALQSRRNLMTTWPESRLKIDSFYETGNTRVNKLPCRGAHFVDEDTGAFDAPFFSITAKEAAGIDPQHRWTLEAAYRAFENAGYPIESLKGTQTAVFSATFSDDYARLSAKDPDTAPVTAVTGTSQALLANRVSWFFDLSGPSVQVDTACSSSMVALDLACQSLRNGNSSSALVTGSNLILSPERSTQLSNMGFLSPDGVCYSFDHRANGYARGEGVVAMLLKPVHDAIRDGDMIRAVIRGSGTNQDGKTASITQPSSKAQEALIRSVYKKAGLDFASTRYFEAHGTGTPVGDPLEMKAIGNVFRTSRSKAQPLYVGSLKANVGHMEGCAGLAGILKAILVLERGAIPPNALFEKMNPDINANYYNIRVPVKSTPWPSNDLRRVSVNSFGFGGTNGHAVLDDTYGYLHERSLVASIRRARALPVATDRSKDSRFSELDGHRVSPAEDYEHDQDFHDRSEYASPKADINGANGTNGAHGVKATNGWNKAWTTDGSNELDDTERFNGSKCSAGANGSHGSHMNLYGASGVHEETTDPWKRCQKPPPQKLLVFSASDEKALKRMIQSYDDYKSMKSTTNEKPTVDELTYALAARRSCLLWRASAVVGEEIMSQSGHFPISGLVRSSDKITLAYAFTGQGAQYVNMGLDLLQYPVFRQTLLKVQAVYDRLGCDWTIPEQLSNSRAIDRPENSQPLTTALQLALVELLESWGITPSTVVGHSSGEIAAAYACGALSLESACRVSYYRGKLAGELRQASLSNPGAMISVNLPDCEVRDHLRKLDKENAKAIQVACINSPFNCTLSGNEDAIEMFKDYLDDEGIFAQKLKTGVAYHSAAMQAIAERYASLIGFCDPGDRTEVPMISSVTGKLVSPKVLRSAQYWVDNLVQPVRFAQAVRNLVQGIQTPDITDVIEIGSHATLKRPIQDTIHHALDGKGEIRYSSVLLKSKPPVRAALELAGNLFTRGYPVSVAAANQQTAGQPFMVNGPEYPFDHSKTYWSESRISRDFRLRAPVPEILGVRASDWNPLEPRWRNLVSLESMPWIKDHVVSDTVIFPGMGLLVMAIEAAKQMSSADRELIGYYIKCAQFMRPVIIPKSADEHTEVIVRLQPIQKPYEKESVWSQVTISSYTNDQWSECFTATIQLQYKEPQGPMETGEERRLADRAILDAYELADQDCTRRVDRQAFYKYTTASGLKYGDYFQLLDDIRWDGHDTAIARVSLTTKHKTSSLVHPAVLDSAVQVLITQGSNGASQTASTNVPYELRDGWISASDWQDTASVRYLTKTPSRETSQNTQGTIYAVNEHDAVLCNFQKLVSKPVADSIGDDSTGFNMLHRVEWKPQMSLLDPNQLHEVCVRDVPAKDLSTTRKHHELLESTLAKVLRKVSSEIRIKSCHDVPEFLEKYITWMEAQVNNQPGLAQADVPSEADIEASLKELESFDPSWTIFSAVARNLTGILSGQIDPLRVAFDTELAKNFYAGAADTIYDESYNTLLDLIVHETPNLRMLEVGAGSGGWTQKTLAAIREYEQRTGANAVVEYWFTDISPAFFEKAQEQLPEMQGRIHFKQLDIERDVEEQGFPAGTFDVVIAGSVLHATADLTHTVQNVRKLLKPGGRLINLEFIVPQRLSINFAFGTLPGWWLSNESWRLSGPCIDESKWDQLLKENGFSGNDLVIRDYEDITCHTFSILVSRAVEATPSKSQGPPVSLLVDPKSEAQLALAEELVNTLPCSKVDFISILSGQGARSTAKGVVVSLLELDRLLLLQPSEEEFDALKSIIESSDELLWLTVSGTGDDTPPYDGVAQGFFRSFRSEMMDKRLVSLSIENDQPSLGHNVIAGHLQKVFNAAFVDGSSEVEYLVRGGHILTGRLVEDKTLAEDVTSMIIPQTRTESWSPGPPLKLCIGTPGLLDTLHFTQDPVPERDLVPGEVEIEAKAWGLSFRDIFVALGRLDGTDLGIDCAGVVTRVGSGCNDLQPGDHVVMTTPGCMRSFPRSPRQCVVKIPKTLSFEVAASMLNPGTTAYYCLMEVARLRRGESILIHSATGSTGQIAILMAQMIGAEVYATVGFPEKKQLLVEEFGIPEDHVLYSRNTQFAAGIKRMTGGRGVDVVLNSLSGDDLLASWGCVAPYGRFIEIGKSDIVADSPLPMGNFSRNVSFCAVDLYYVIENSPDLVAKLAQNVVELLGDGKIHPPKPLHVYPASQLEQAFRLLQSGKNPGRIVISISPDDQVKKCLLRKSTWKFPSDATYVVAGGLGGLGRAVLGWMASKGAKNIVVPSRSGGSSNAAKDTLEELRAMGVNIMTPQCDVADAASLSNVVEDCAASLPPIRGCINASMVLQDAMFSNMTHAQWSATLASKASTSWNLHQQLPRPLDFFIQFSSLAGVYGSLGQPNYAAGCGFQDALARHRVACGEKAVSLDIGWMQNIGIISENETYQRQRETAADMRKVQGAELLAILDTLCDPNAPLPPPGGNGHQLLIGVTTPEEQLANGHEFPAATLQRPLFSGFTQRTGATPEVSTSSSSEDPVRLFKAAGSPKEKAEAVVTGLANKLAHTLAIVADDVVSSKHLADYGVDSLVAVELRNWIAAAFKSNVAVFDIMGAPSIAEVGNVVVSKSELVA